LNWHFRPQVAIRRVKPRLLSDNGSSYISGDLAERLDERKITHIRGAPHHTQNQGKTPSRGLEAKCCQAAEGWHQALKNRILLENYLPGALEAQLDDFVQH